MKTIESTNIQAENYVTNRILHHNLCIEAYEKSFIKRGLTERYQVTELRRLHEVFQYVEIGDENLNGIKRPIDTFDLINQRLSKKIVEACYQILGSEFNASRVKACLKAVDKYCKFLQEVPYIYLIGQKTLSIVELYGHIASPVNRYTIPRQKPSDASRIYLTASEYKVFLSYLWDSWDFAIQGNKLCPRHQMFLMAVIAGELGLRCQEILGLKLEHLNIADNVCIVTEGKGSNGSGNRKRDVPLNDFVKASLSDFLKHFPRKRGEPLFQNHLGEELSKSTASKWMNRAVKEMKALKLPIVFEERFGWHALRRTYARGYVENGGDFWKLMQNTGWKFASTATHYIGASKIPINYQGS